MREHALDVAALVRKEALMILKDKRSRFILVMPILVQTLLFGYVASYDVNRIDYVLLDEDRTFSSRELVAKFDGSGIFRRVGTATNVSQTAALIDAKKALAAVHIGPQFERKLNAGQTAPVQIIVDGRNSNVAGIASSYASVVVNDFSKARSAAKGTRLAETVVSARAWFNPNLETRWNIVSGMIAVMAAVQVLVLAGQSVAREKEQGTFDQLLVTPYSAPAVMFGKALPPVLIGLMQSSIVLLLALHWFNIPYAGSFALLYLGLTVFKLSIVGIGLCVSALTNTMQQAMLFSFSLLMPMILLSGFATPIASMPYGMQIATLLNPARHGVEFAQRVYLEGAGFAELTGSLWPLAAIAAATLSAASGLFRKRLG